MLQALLAAPEPDDPQDAVVARQYQDNLAVFRQTAQHWSAAFAGGGYKNPAFDTMLRCSSRTIRTSPIEFKLFSPRVSKISS